MKSVRGLFVLAIAVAIKALPALAWEDDPLAEFDMQYRDEHVVHLIVPVDFSGATYPFLIDTGYSSTSFDERLRPLLRRRTGVSRILAVGGEYARATHQAPRGTIGAVRLAPLDRVDCHDIRAMTNDEIDGILGIDALRGSILR